MPIRGTAQAFKSFTVDVDIVGREGKYQGKYRPDKAFELRVITELVSNWNRNRISKKGKSLNVMVQTPSLLSC